MASCSAGHGAATNLPAVRGQRISPAVLPFRHPWAKPPPLTHFRTGCDFYLAGLKSFIISFWDPPPGPMSNQTTLLRLQIGPVQDFIAQARSTRDLWSGSYLLSWLMAAGAKALVEAAGGDRQLVISPVLEGQPIYEFQINPEQARGDHSNDAILTPNFTNILVAELPPERAAAAVEMMVQAIRSERDAIAEAVWNKLDTAGLVPEGEKARFMTQVKHFPAITWRLTPAPQGPTADTLLAHLPLDGALEVKLKDAAAAGDWFPAQITRNSWELDAVRTLREFRGWNSAGDGHDKDSLTGREEAVIGGRVWWEKRVKPLHEAAKAAAAAGRPLNNFLWPILFRERQRDDCFGALQLIKRVWHWAYLTEVKKLEATHRREPGGKQFPFPSTLHLALHDPAKNVREDQPGEIEAKREEEISVQAAHNGYFAVLALDGDHMGAWLGGENNPAGPTKDFRCKLSARLSKFALYCVRPIVEACDGRLIYAGGEDVLALLPADTAVECARFLRAAYRGETRFIAHLTALAARLYQHHDHHRYAEPSDLDDGKPKMSASLVAAKRGSLFAEVDGKAGVLWFDPSLTPTDSGRGGELPLPGGILTAAHGHLSAHAANPAIPAIPDVSAGLAIAHFKEPLQDVVQAALAAEKRAKDKLGRGALAITLVKHSGETVKWGAKWELGGLALLDLLQRGRGAGVFSSRFPHQLIEVLSPYLLAREAGEPAQLEEVAGFRDQVDAIITREFTRVLERQKGPAGAVARSEFIRAHQPEEKLRSFLGELRCDDAQEKLRALIGLCQVAAFIEPAVHSSTFVRDSSPTSPAA